MAKKAAAKKATGRKPQLRLVDSAPDDPPSQPPRRKLIAFDPDTFAALDVYRRDSMKDWEELAEEAFRDLLNKHGRSADLRTALKRSVKKAGGASRDDAPKSASTDTKRPPRSTRG